MKLLSDKIISVHGGEYLEFEATNNETSFLTSSRLIKLVQQIDPWVNLAYCVPVVQCDEDGHTKLQIRINEPFGEKLIKEILIQYVKNNFLLLADANKIFESVCKILSTEFNQINPDVSPAIKANKEHDFFMASTQMLLKGLINSSFQNKDEKEDKQKQQKKNDDGFCSGLTGLKGAFK